MALNTVIVRNFEDLAIDRNEWDQIVKKNEINTIFQTYDWISCWWSVFGKQDTLFFILVYDDTIDKSKENLIAIAPLCIRYNSKNRKELVFVGEGNADYVDFLILDKKEEVLRTILEVIANHNDEFSSFLLRNIPYHSSTYGLLMAIANTSQLNIEVIQKILCPTLVVKNKKTEVENILHKYSVRRPFNYFSKQGNLRHEVIKDITTANKHFSSFFNQHINRWYGTSNPSLFWDEANKQFYQKLLTTLLPKQQVLFSAVMLDDTPLSYHFGFDYNSILTWYKPSYAVEYAKKSPGTLLVKYLIEYALDKNRKELDFTIGDEPFKDRFANVYRYNVVMIFFLERTDYVRFNRIRKIKNIAKFFIKRK